MYLFAILISTLLRFYLANKKIFHIHLNILLQCSFHNKPHASKGIYRLILSHTSQFFKQKLTLSMYQHCQNPFAIKQRRKGVEFSPKSLLWTWKQTFRYTFPSKNLPPDDTRVLYTQPWHGYLITGNSFNPRMFGRLMARIIRHHPTPGCGFVF